MRELAFWSRGSGPTVNALQPWAELFYVLDQNIRGGRKGGGAHGRKSWRERGGREEGSSDIPVMPLMIKPWS